jgi:hypothetical protein
MRELIVIDDGAPISQTMSIARALWHLIHDPGE